jgi:hypothetical protein
MQVGTALEDSRKRGPLDPRSAPSDRVPRLGTVKGAATRARLIQLPSRGFNEETAARHRDSAFEQYACECTRPSCESTVSMSLTEYDEVRRQPTRFLVAHGHVTEHLHRRVEVTSRYQVLEARHVDAGDGRPRARRSALRLGSGRDAGNGTG